MSETCKCMQKRGDIYCFKLKNGKIISKDRKYSDILIIPNDTEEFICSELRIIKWRKNGKNYYLKHIPKQLVNNTGESEDHKNAKDKIIHCLENGKVIFTIDCDNCKGCEKIIYSCKNNTNYSFKKEHSEKINGHRKIYDVAILFKNEVELIIEIYHSHKTLPKNREKNYIELKSTDVNSSLPNSEDEYIFKDIKDKKYRCQKCRIKGKFYIKDSGAGSRKTWTSVDNIKYCLEKNSNEISNDLEYLNIYENKKNIFFVAKTHGACYELNENIEKFLERYKIKNCIKKIDGKKKLYIIGDIKILISTIDSLIGKINHIEKHKSSDELGEDKYQNNALNISGECNKLEYKFEDINYKINLNNETLLVIDEAQDLSEHYLKGTLQMLENNNFTIYVIGNIIQSIQQGEKSLYKQIKNLNSDNIIKMNSYHICWRMQSTLLMETTNIFCKEIFERNDFPQIQGIGNEKYPNTKFTTIKIPMPFDTSVSDENISEILKNMKRQLEDYELFPDDYIFLFPAINNNKFVDRLSRGIDLFWDAIFKDEEYRKMVREKNIKYWNEICNLYENKKQDSHSGMFSYILRSDKETVNHDNIKNKTGICSTFSFKGHGRKIVYFYYDTKLIKNYFAKGDQLIEDSYKYVSLTRSIIENCLLYSNISDEFVSKIIRNTSANSNVSNLENFIDVSILNNNEVNIDEFINLIKPNGKYEKFKNTICNISEKLQENSEYCENPLVNFSEHGMRHQCNLITLMNEFTDRDKIIENDLHKTYYIDKINLVDYDDDEYKKFFKYLNNPAEFEKIFQMIPFIIVDPSRICGKIIYTYLDEIIPKIIRDKNTKCPYEQLIIYVLYQFKSQPQNHFKNNRHLYSTLVNLLYCNEDDFKKHCFQNKCNCMFLFESKGENKLFKEYDKNLIEHYENTMYEKIKSAREKIYEDCPDEKFYATGPKTYINNSFFFSISSKTSFILNEENFIYNITIKPNIENYYNLIAKILFDSYILFNSVEEDHNKKFRNIKEKNIRNVIITYNSKEPLYLEEFNEEFFKNIGIKKIIEDLNKENINKNHEIFIKMITPYIKLENVKMLKRKFENAKEKGQLFEKYKTIFKDEEKIETHIKNNTLLIKLEKLKNDIIDEM